MTQATALQVTAAPADPTAAAREPLVRFQGVGMRYGPRWALQDVQLSISDGEVVSLLGPNGAGKTTAIHLMLGLIRPTTGQVTAAGGDPTDARTRQRIGAMLQEASIPGALRVREIVELFSAYYPRPLPLGQVLERATLTGLAHRFYRSLSGGEKKRVQFAVAICGDPRLIYLDEPTANMDVESRRALHACVRGLAADGRCVVFATHYMDEADSLASRIVLLNRGRILQDASPAAIKAMSSLMHASCRTRLDVDAVRALAGVREVERVGDRLTVRFQAEVPVARELYRLDPELADLTIERASLEQVFLTLVQNDGGAQP